MWANLLHCVELDYNTTHYSSINIMPFKVVYECDPLKIVRYGSQPSLMHALDQFFL